MVGGSTGGERNVAEEKVMTMTELNAGYGPI
jgi:hypothetical protein